MASYTWTLLHDLVEVPAQPGERHHPVRLFIGSGMPRGLWRRVQERFKPARVLEFYASAETGAILVNLRSAKPGAMGRPLPGSPEVRLAAYDLKANRLALGQDGFVRKCGWEEIGLLLARARSGETAEADPLRGVFARDDAWLSTGDLFRRDDEGDYWRVDSIRDVIRTETGPRFTAPIRDALSDLPPVDLAVAYGWRPREGAAEIAVAAVTLRPGHELAPEDLASLPSYARAAVVRVVESLPVTTWYRPLTAPLREAGLSKPGEGPAWYLDRGGRRYRRLTDAARRRLEAG